MEDVRYMGLFSDDIGDFNIIRILVYFMNITRSKIVFNYIF